MTERLCRLLQGLPWQPLNDPLAEGTNESLQCGFHSFIRSQESTSPLFELLWYGYARRAANCLARASLNRFGDRWRPRAFPVHPHTKRSHLQLSRQILRPSFQPSAGRSQARRNLKAGGVSRRAGFAREDGEDKCFALLEILLKRLDFRCTSLKSNHEECFKRFSRDLERNTSIDQHTKKTSNLHFIVYLAARP